MLFSGGFRGGKAYIWVPQKFMWLRGMESWERAKICPRCGKPFNYVNKVRIETSEGKWRVYKVCVHVLGYERDPKTGRRRRIVKTCYVGPSTYEYVTKLHEKEQLTLMGALEPGRVYNYLIKTIDYLIAGNALERLGLVAVSEDGSRAINEAAALELSRQLRSLAEKIEAEVKEFKNAQKELEAREREEKQAGIIGDTRLAQTAEELDRALRSRLTLADIFLGTGKRGGGDGGK